MLNDMRILSMIVNIDVDTDVSSELMVLFIYNKLEGARSNLNGEKL